jgi:hypothetical protein
MDKQTSQIYSESYFQYLHDRGRFRRVLRGVYLRDICKECIGKTIDLGCGVGELLQKLPPGSIGLEVNKVAVDFCTAKGMSVSLYDPEEDDYQFKGLRQNEFQTFTMNHVLEHIFNSWQVIDKIFSSCSRLGIERIVFTVPGIKGFASDSTHQTFIDSDYLSGFGFFDHPLFKLKQARYFPVNNVFFSRYFTHNELRLIFDRTNA